MKSHASRCLLAIACQIAIANVVLGFHLSSNPVLRPCSSAQLNHHRVQRESFQEPSLTRTSMNLFVSFGLIAKKLGRTPAERVRSPDLTAVKSQTMNAVQSQEEEGQSDQIRLVPAERYTSSEWLNCLLSLPFSRALRRCMSHLIANTVCAALIWLAYIKFATMRWIVHGLTPQAHLLLGGALGLLLVFRTNTAYDRFWEARRLWGGLIARVRELARLAHSSMQGAERDRFLQLLAAAPPILLQHLRSGWIGWERSGGGNNGRDLINELVQPEDAAQILKAVNRPYLLVKMLGSILRRVYTDVGTITAQRGHSANAALSPMDVATLQANVIVERWHAEQCLFAMTETIGGCERIVKTTVPILYSRHTSRFLSVWCFTLPLVFVEALQWRVIPVSLIVCWVSRSLFVIEEVGHLIEDPFNMVYQGLDELKLDKSFPNMRLEVAERLPFTAGLRTQTLIRGP